MSSYYSQRVAYKTKGKQYSRSNAIINDDLKYSASTGKKMATLTSAYGTQKAGSSVTTAYVASDYLNGGADIVAATAAIKFEPTTPSKISTHLLDHGYGATPQPAYPDEAGFKGYTKSADAGITHYYKVRFRMPPPMIMIDFDPIYS